MTVHSTNKWIQQYVDSHSGNMADKWKYHKDLICKPVSKYFTNTSILSLQDHLLRHGLFPPSPEDEELLRKWLKKKYFQLVENLYEKYRSSWKGPSANIFIFPSNPFSRDLTEKFSGCTGLSYPKHLFLFLSNQAKVKQITALFLHEYSHTCRLQYFSKPEAEYTLLDAIILEGIAEYIVRKKLGEDSGNDWINQYSSMEAKEYYEKWIKPNITITRTHPKHDLLMYGNRHGIPQNLGYHIGYYILTQFTKDKEISINDILYMENDVILKDINL
ncbi:Uncharacterized protein YjaZ [Gracilibacillus ureilyticus]|uniref:Uncharacterized protein YjaZ n=1 Tax=Gracilibacillus ureilyticus TaxID=531814 RepID=A0A1H9MVI0_9BACI|nr:DUF2268 domain-containing putative Zn-dependent protease [Gracilibacillus ureilyticus]SER27678.1 Uncharacterized protein YjaZ [Gracilibacillus ureilyticus]